MCNLDKWRNVKGTKKTDAAWFWWRYRVEQGYYSVRGIVEVRKEGVRGGVRGKPRGHRGTTRARRPQIRYHLATTRRDLHARVPSSSRRGEEEKRKGQRSIFSPVFPLRCAPFTPPIYLRWFKESTRRRSRSVSFFSPFFLFFFLSSFLSLHLL